MVRQVTGFAAILVFVATSACERSGSPTAPAPDSGSAPAAATYRGGRVTREELLREAARLPPELRSQFARPAGQRELAVSLVDKRLLVQEARRHGLAEQPELRRQVLDLEERLIVQALLAQEEKAAAPATEAEVRAFYEAHKHELEQPERVRVRRFLARAAAGASKAERQKARQRAEAALRRLRSAEARGAVLAGGDGPEAGADGELGLLTRAELGDRRQAEAAFALQTPEALSPVIEVTDGFAVLQLVERRPARLPALAEVRSELEARMAPVRQRQTFDQLRRRLRAEADVQVLIGAEP